MIAPMSVTQYEEENQALKKQIEQRTGKTTEQLYLEREKRVRDAVDLKTPDRVPFSVNVENHLYTGVSNSAAYYDPMAWKVAMRKIIIDLEPDMCNVGLPMSGAGMEALDVKNRLWPGGPIPSYYEYQFVEGEYMKEDEYDMFISDPTGFMLRRYWPRIYGTLAPLTKLPNLDSMTGIEGITPIFASLEFQDMMSRLAEAGRKTAEFRQAIGNNYEEMAQLGFPAFAPTAGAGVGGAPFDTLSSFFRGMKGSMVDMYRRPDKLVEACDLIIKRRIAGASPADPKQRGNPKKVGMPLWRGDKAFMSESQFKKFYWPGLKKALQATIDLGFVPVPFFEAAYRDRYEYLLELPKGKIVASIEHMDALQAREILGGHTCLYVRGPLSSRLWTLREVESYTKDLIDKCGKKGGLMLNIRLPDKGTTKDVQAMLKSINEYSRY